MVQEFAKFPYVQKYVKRGVALRAIVFALLIAPGVVAETRDRNDEAYERDEIALYLVFEFRIRCHHLNQTPSEAGLFQGDVGQGRAVRRRRMSVSTTIMPARAIAARNRK